MKRAVGVTVNGKDYERAVDVRSTLADFLREDLDLTGTHVGCEHGVCGACTVLLDEAPARRCPLLAGQRDGADRLTVRGPGAPVRPLPAGHPDERLRVPPGPPGAAGGRDPRNAGGEPLPLHRLPAHRG